MGINSNLLENILVDTVRRTLSDTSNSSLSDKVFNAVLESIPNKISFDVEPLKDSIRSKSNYIKKEKIIVVEYIDPRKNKWDNAY